MLPHAIFVHVPQAVGGLLDLVPLQETVVLLISLRRS